MGSVDLTVIIPTYDGSQRFPEVLDALKCQHISSDVQWEIVVVDNNSQDDTSERVQYYQEDWPLEFPLRYCLEPRQGLAFARQRGIEEANGAYVAFLDDDTIPDKRWVECAFDFGQAHPKAGAFGGQVHGDFEVAPPENFKRIQSFLAIKERGEQSHLYDPQNLVLPPGAGLVVRRQAWLESVPKCLSRVSSGEDFEASLHLHQAGWEIWYCPTMHLFHQIPKWRLEPKYLLKLSKTVGLCVCELRLLHKSKLQIPIVVMRILLGNLRRIIRHLLHYRWQLKSDLVALCELRFFVYSFMSPFHLLKKKLNV